MKFLDRDQNASESGEARISELTTALQEAERKLAERELWVAQAIDQTEAARAQYEQANARAETLRRHLIAKEEQLTGLQEQLHRRDLRIAALEALTAQKAASVSDAVVKPAPANSDAQLDAMGLALESLEQPGTQYRIAKAITTLGRMATNDVAIDSNSVSRFHARIVVEADGVYLVDLGSTNGCKVNGKRIDGRQMIGDSDTISIGSVKFKFSAGAPSVEGEERAMQETHVLLNDSAIFIPAPRSKPQKAQ